METHPMELHASRKRSVIVKKRRTSISLEDSFWSSLHAIVRMENITIGDFIDRISCMRSTLNLSSSLRVAVLEYYQRLVIDRAIIGGPSHTHASHEANDPSHRADQSKGLERLSGSWNGFERRQSPYTPTMRTPEGGR
jgi:predicted DNA-binding ribbon-helix-helix protein